jgi:hypothetical protein
VLGDLEGWRRGLAEAGVEVVAESAASRAELVVAPAARAPEAMSHGTPMLILEGRLRRGLQAEGLDVQRLVARPSAAAPALLLALDQPRAAAYAVGHWSIVDRRWKLARRALAARLVRSGRWPPIGSMVIVCQRRAAAPAIVQEAGALGLPAELDWVLTLGQGDVLSRNVFHLFPRGHDEPEWVLKFARVPDYDAPFERDEHGLKLAAAAGGAVAARAPRLVGRLTWNGIHGSVETAGRGARLREVLTSPVPRADKLPLIDAIAGWIVGMGLQTSAPRKAFEPERDRLLGEVIASWAHMGADPDLVLDLPPLAPVLQHNDLGSWNVLVQEGDFTVVDWESSRAHGLPLWDLLYFLADALALLDRAAAGATRHAHTASLFRGDAPSSPLLFAWVRRAANELQIPPDAVGRVATLCWLHHSLSHVQRRGSLGGVGMAAENTLHGTELVAPAWLSDPALGPNWSRWRD